MRVRCSVDVEVVDGFFDGFDAVLREQDPAPSVVCLGRGFADPSVVTGTADLFECAGDLQVGVGRVEVDVVEQEGEDFEGADAGSGDDVDDPHHSADQLRNWVGGVDSTDPRGIRARGWRPDRNRSAVTAAWCRSAAQPCGLGWSNRARWGGNVRALTTQRSGGRFAWLPSAVRSWTGRMFLARLREDSGSRTPDCDV